MDQLLKEFERNATACGTHVHWAFDGDTARAQVLQIMRNANAARAIKSKSMATEQIHLNGALSKEGFEVIESDLGKFILQLKGDAPCHFVFPSMHFKRGEIHELFSKHYAGFDSGGPEALEMFAR